MAAYEKKKKQHLAQPQRKPMPKHPNRPAALNTSIAARPGYFATAYPAVALIFTVRM